MKKVSNEYRQEVFEFLCLRGVPNVLAGAIAAKIMSRVHLNSVRRIVLEGFIWVGTPEGAEFWNEIDEQLFEMGL